MKRALITGIYGQDGAYLASELLNNGYEVFGMTRRVSDRNSVTRLHRLGIESHVRILDGDLSDLSSTIRAVRESKPDHIYNLAAQSFVGTSWTQPIATIAATGGFGVLNVLEAARLEGVSHFYQASSSEMFGAAPAPQCEWTPFHPRSPYGVAKLSAHWIVRNYRESFGMHAVSGILFNHESPLRGSEFVTRKITMAASRIRANGGRGSLNLGTLDAMRDWGHAKDYVRAMRMMLEADKPNDYVVATGTSYTINEFLRAVFSMAGLDTANHVYIDPSLIRPAEVDVLRGDPTMIDIDLGWRAEIGMRELAAEMLDADMRLLKGDYRC